ncbi:MAG TPA: CoA transferase, partial [Variovorax sp.]|nr:CoA transferase [Variovorax sp.]
LQNEREWDAFCRLVLRQPDLAGDERFSSNSRRVAHRDELRALILERFATLEAQQVVQRLDDAQIANARVNDMHDVWEHPQLKARGRWTEVATPNGPIPALLPPGRTDAYEPRMDGVPGLGQHTRDILRELGWSAEAIDDMRQTHVI